jgi:hypothetical protein
MEGNAETKLFAEDRGGNIQKDRRRCLSSYRKTLCDPGNPRVFRWLEKTSLQSKESKHLVILFSKLPVDQPINFEGSEINKLVEETIKYVTNFDDWSEICHIGNWTFGNAFIFMGSMATTIGYGKTVPHVFYQRNNI